jgi:hypothetical protein
MARWLIAACVVLGVASGVRADIYEWRDTAGVRHFTNRKDAVPADASAAVRVTEPAPAAVERAAPPAVPPEAPRGAQVVTTAPLAEVYAQGVRDGWALAAAEAAPEPAPPPLAIEGPLAVAAASNAAPVVYPLAYPLVTTSFDRGRSRHLTLRMLLQDQFQLDRDGPYVYYPFPPGGLGPNLRPALPRGLRHRATPARVFTR